MARRSGGNGMIGFVLGAVAVLIAITAWVVWSNRVDIPRPAGTELSLPRAPDLPAPAPMPDPQPAPAPLPTPG